MTIIRIYSGAGKTMKWSCMRALSLAFIGLAVCHSALADAPKVLLSIRHRHFVPQRLQVPAKTRVEVLVKNEDSIPAEFESADLSREVVVPGKSTVSVYVGPLSAGRYRFFNDFNPAAKGWVASVPQRSD